ncbi:hypothetical protein KAH55_07670 [bacterium]|nr:hypothetical protein [bacterium]
MYRIVFSCLLAVQLLAYAVPGFAVGAAPEKRVLKQKIQKKSVLHLAVQYI